MADICTLGFNDLNKDGTVQFEEISGNESCHVTMIEKTLADSYGLARDDLKNITANDMNDYMRVMKELLSNMSNELHPFYHGETNELYLKRNTEIAEKIRENLGVSPFIEKMVQERFLKKYAGSLETYIAFTHFRHFVMNNTAPSENELKRLGKLCGKTEKDVESDIGDPRLRENVGVMIHDKFLEKALSAAKDGSTTDIIKEYLARSGNVMDICGKSIDPKDGERIWQARKNADEILNDPKKLKEYIDRYIPLAEDVANNPQNYMVSHEVLSEDCGGAYHNIVIHDNAGSELFSIILLFKGRNDKALCFEIVQFNGDIVSIGSEENEMKELSKFLAKIVTADPRKFLKVL